MENIVALGGVNYKVAPLRSLQVAEFYDAIDKSDGESKVATISRSLLTIGRSLRNAKAEGFDDNLSDDALIEKVDQIADFTELDPVFGIVLEITGLKKAAPGEAKAADESISNASSAALSATPAGPSAE